MCKNIFIYDDECSGKSKQDYKKMKDYLSKTEFTFRVPYGRASVKMKRLATLAGSCNEIDVLNDPTGNRRIVVLEIDGNFDLDKYKSIDKNQLFAQIMWCYRQGFECDLTREEVKLMNDLTDDKHSELSYEKEKIMSLFMAPEHAKMPFDFMTATQIKDKIDACSKQAVSLRRLGLELKRLGYERIKLKDRYGYAIKAHGTSL